MNVIEREIREYCSTKPLADVHVGIAVEHAVKYGIDEGKGVADRIASKLEAVRQRFNIRCALR